ncbi:MAG: hypothetical protein Q8O67_01260 [Deltaproteobacteria bacterium]|nr:hypothetical protein [Deltaproteobacteria bacterium]
MTVVVVDKLVPGGQGLCRDDKGVFFVDGVAAGDRIEVEVDGKRRGVREGRLLTVLEPSADRAAADCALSSLCGGCDWLHLSRDAQTRWKHATVIDALRRIGRFADDDVTRFLRPLLVPPSAESAARRRARFVVDAGGRLSLSARRSHERVAIPACPALDARLSATVSLMPRLTPGSVVALAVDDEGVVAGLEKEVDVDVVASKVRGVLTAGGKLIGDPVLRGEVTAGFLPARSDALTFSQATRFGGAAIREQVMRGVGEVDGLRVLELFAGAGHLSLPLAKAGAVVDAVEGDARGLAHLVANARAFDLAIAARRAFIDEQLPFGDVDVVVADPPRTGIPGAAELFARLRAQRLVLVSCDLATGARDLAAAAKAGFVVDDVTPIDAFPRTHHVEWVAVLSR